MLKISRLADYSMLLMHYLAKTPRQMQSATEISRCTFIPLPTVSKLLKQLCEAHLVKSLRGVQGGYMIAREPAMISVAEVVVAIDGELAVTDCNLAGSACGLLHSCELSGQWHYINDQIKQLLGGISLVDMQQPVKMEVS